MYACELMELITLTAVSVTKVKEDTLTSDDLVAMAASEASRSNLDNCCAVAISPVLYLESGTKVL